MKCAFVTCHNIFSSHNSGGVICAYRNYEYLCDYFGRDNVTVILFTNSTGPYKSDPMAIPSDVSHKIFSTVKSNIGAVIASLQGYRGAYAHIYRQAEEYIYSNAFSCVFFDGSIFGRILMSDREIITISFFHNIEADYEINKIKSGGLKSILPYFASKSGDKNAVNANLNICLNERDSERLHNLYGRSADLIMPMSFRDSFDYKRIHSTQSKHLLFVGSYFPPNADGMAWFLKNVCPLLDDNISIDIVGKNWENYAAYYAKYPNVNVIGTVEETAKYYYEHPAMIMPIRYGSGIKIKTAEALMYGKTIFASDEALEGYDVNGISGVIRCNTPTQFATAINDFFSSQNIPYYQDDVRRLFLDKYEYKRVYDSFRAVLDKFFPQKISPNAANTI